MKNRSHLILAALREVAVVEVGAGGGTSVHDEIAAATAGLGVARAGRADAVVGVVFAAEVVANLVGERDVRDGLGHARLIVHHRDNARVEALGDALQRLASLAHAAHAARQLGHPRQAECAVREIARRKRVRQTIVGEVV